VSHSDLDTFIAHDERNDAGGAALYELAIAVGQKRREQADTARVDLGEIARRLSVRWGDATIERYAKDIGVADRTLRDYRQVVSLLTYGAARQFVQDGVPWKVMLLSARYHADSAADALAFLETAARDHMTIDQAERALVLDSAPKAPSLADDLAAKLARVLDAVDGVPEHLERDAYLHDVQFGGTSLHDARYVQWLRAKAQAIRDALAGATERAGAVTDRVAASVTAEGA
jgi:hypothetical protein